MLTRCLNPRAHAYERYGGADITVCDRWRESFEDFLADMGPRPSLKYSLDRFPNKTGNYEPGNCRWATREQQADNRQDNVLVQIAGQTMTLARAISRFGSKVHRETVRRRIRRGWNIADALGPPTR